MEIKNIKVSLVVLFVMVIASFSFFATAQEQALTTKNIFLDSDQDGLSDEEEKVYGTDPQKADTDGDGYSDGAEIRSGYDPIKASNDKLAPSTALLETNIDPNEKNLTREVTQKITTILNTSDPDDQDITIEQVKNLVDESLATQVSQDELPEVTTDDILIKKENLKGLSDEKIVEIKKEDFTDYIAGVSYVLSSNSPTPITSSSDITTLSSSITQDFATAITSQDPEAIAKLLDTNQKIVEQMKDVSVPEDLVDTHIEALRIAKYAENLNNLLAPNPTDPLMSIANFSKLASFMDYVSTFSNDLTEKVDSYGITFDDSVKDKLSSYGVSLPDEELVQKLSK